MRDFGCRPVYGSAGWSSCSCPQVKWSQKLLCIWMGFTVLNDLSFSVGSEKQNKRTSTYNDCILQYAVCFLYLVPCSTLVWTPCLAIQLINLCLTTWARMWRAYVLISTARGNQMSFFLAYQPPYACWLPHFNNISSVTQHKDTVFWEITCIRKKETILSCSQTMECCWGEVPLWTPPYTHTLTHNCTITHLHTFILLSNYLKKKGVHTGKMRLLTDVA